MAYIDNKDIHYVAWSDGDHDVDLHLKTDTLEINNAVTCDSLKELESLISMLLDASRIWKMKTKPEGEEG